ncbi:MAG: hypothetical protein M9924_21275 [Rhizobiaceae bacterium]|nr:hypothetical protein [Rhizobiaceae bacterium]
MKTLVTYCQLTGRRVRKFINRLVARFAQTGKLKLSLSFSIPFIAKVEVSYETRIDKPK